MKGRSRFSSLLYKTSKEKGGSFTLGEVASQEVPRKWDAHCQKGPGGGQSFRWLNNIILNIIFRSEEVIKEPRQPP